MAGGEDQEIAAGLGELGERGAPVAEDPGAALQWVAGEPGRAFIPQERVQGFCWYQLPVKWFVDPGEKLRVVSALAEVLDLLQLPRYAVICRSGGTREILNAYEVGAARGKAAFRRVAAASGITPPGLPGFEWGAVMGQEEASARSSAADFRRSPSPAAIWSRDGRGGGPARRNSCVPISMSRRPGCPGRRWPR